MSGGQGDPHTFYKDQDGDYWGSDDQPLDTLCNFPPAGYSVLHGDCNDQNPQISPAREEICNGVDDDCDGKVDQPDKPGDLMFGQPYDGVTEFECAGVQGWKVKTCPAGRLNCDESYLDACETIGTTLCNCHACGKTCAFSCGESDCEEISAINTGDTHTCAIVTPTAGASTTGGKVACWGRNDVGQLGDGTTKDSATPVLIGDLSGVSAIALGEKHSCAIVANSGIVCWGNNASGQLGAGSIQAQSVYPIQVRVRTDWGTPKRLASGTNHVCAIFEPGLLACWGVDESGQLGDGFDKNGFSDQPQQVVREVGGVQVPVDDAEQVVAGEGHTCLLAAGKVECWGDNTLGELGEDPETVPSRTVARPVPGLEAIVVDDLAASSGHTCARSGTDVYCWGSNLFGELAKDDGFFGTPTKIPLPPDIVSIAAGRFFGCARSRDGTARCWGSNGSGQLAKPIETSDAVPSPIPLQNIVGIFGGDGRHVCALTKDTQSWCWGQNDFGQLGNNSVSDQQVTPEPVHAPGSSQGCIP